MESLLFEIGVEEMPAACIWPAVEGLSKYISKELTNLYIDHGSIEMFATPRRLSVLIKNVNSEQEETAELIYGPPESISVNSDGSYNIPAIKFAAKVGVSLDRLEIISFSKGRYVCVRKIKAISKTKDLLKFILPKAILQIPFPKKMKWSDLSIQFVRPIKGIVAIFGSNVIKFSLCENIKSGRISNGHFLMNAEKIEIFEPDDYVKIMRKVNVIVDVSERRKIIYNGIKKVANEIGGNIVYDDELLDIVTNLVEYPVIISGKIDNSFLSMPKDILITVMKKHQKYFSVVNKENELLPFFIAVNNTISNNKNIVISGNERVIDARLSDAKFFYDQDISKSMNFWVEKLTSVLFYDKLGSMYDKTVRINLLGQYLSLMFAPELFDKVVRSAYLCKADLVTYVVNEFPSLQGYMGNIYANLMGESSEICLALKEHYLPDKSGGILPSTTLGSIISIADRIDSICGCFLVNLVPTGNTDPYGLRRQAIGLLRVIMAKKFNFSLDKIIEIGIKLYLKHSGEKCFEIVKKINVFLKKRFHKLFLDKGYSIDVILAVTSVIFNNVVKSEQLIIFLYKLKKEKKHFLIISTFKRLKSILSKSNFSGNILFEKLLKNDFEINLYETNFKIDQEVKILLKKEYIDVAFKKLVILCNSVELFFKNVMVMTKDKKVCYNRLALLNLVLSTFLRFADFSKIEK